MDSKNGSIFSRDLQKQPIKMLKEFSSLYGLCGSHSSTYSILYRLARYRAPKNKIHNIYTQLTYTGSKRKLISRNFRWRKIKPELQCFQEHDFISFLITRSSRERAKLKILNGSLSRIDP